MRERGGRGEKERLWAKMMGGRRGGSGDVRDGEGEGEGGGGRRERVCYYFYSKAATPAVFIIKYAMPFLSYVE